MIESLFLVLMLLCMMGTLLCFVVVPAIVALLLQNIFILFGVEKGGTNSVRNCLRKIHIYGI